MEYIPRKHQQIADRFLRQHDHAALFLECGLGKTSITMTVLHDYILRDFKIDRALVIAPKKVAEDTWSREAEKWDHLHDLRIAKILGTEKQRIAAAESDADIYVINRENVQWLVEHYGTKWKWDCLVIDELSSFKSPSAKRWRMLKRILPMCIVVWGLTGTPAANGYMDLYAEMYLIDQGQRLGKTLGSYRDTYFNAGARKGHIVYEWRLKPGAKQRIDNILKDVCLSMTADDWLELPERIDLTDHVQMSPAERKVYEKFRQEKVLPLVDGLLAPSVEDAETAVVGITAASVSNKLLQMANGAVYDDIGGVSTSTTRSWTSCRRSSKRRTGSRSSSTTPISTIWSGSGDGSRKRRLWMTHRTESRDGTRVRSQSSSATRRPWGTASTSRRADTG